MKCIFIVRDVYVYGVKQGRENDKQNEDERDEEASVSKLQTLRATAATFFKLNQAIKELHCSLSNTLKGEISDACQLPRVHMKKSPQTFLTLNQWLI